MFVLDLTRTHLYDGDREFTRVRSSSYGGQGAYPSVQLAFALHVRVLEPRKEARRIPALAADLLHFGIKLIDQRRDRQAGAVAAGFGDGDREVLAHPFDGEAEIILAVVHRLVAVLHLPGLRGALGDGVDHVGDGEAGLLRKMDAFGEPL